MYCLPDMKLSGLKFMSCTLSEALHLYLAKCKTKRKVAEKTLAALKPKYMKTIQETPLRGCTCEYCANFGKSRETLIGFGMKGIPRNHSAVIEKSLCPYRRTEPDEMDIHNHYVHEELPGKKCIKWTCDNCGVQKHQEQVMKENITLIRTLQRVSWQQWGNVKYLARDGKKKNKTALITYYSSVAKLLALYFKQLKKIAMHQFQKLWQLRNFNMTLHYLQCGQVLISKWTWCYSPKMKFQEHTEIILKSQFILPQHFFVVWIVVATKLFVKTSYTSVKYCNMTNMQSTQLLWSPFITWRQRVYQLMKS